MGIPMPQLIGVSSRTPSLSDGNKAFDGWVMVGSFDLSDPKLASSLAEFGMEKFANDLSTRYKIDKSVAQPGASCFSVNGKIP